MHGLSALFTIAAAIAVGWSGAAQAANRPEADQSAAPKPPAALRTVGFRTVALQIDLAEAPLRPNRLQPNRSQPSRSLPSNGSNQDSSDQNFKYRLIVQGSSDTLLRQVRQIVPDAFRTTIDGRRVIQAGLFVTREEAEAVQQQLSRLDVAVQLLEFGGLASGTAPRSTGSQVNRSGARTGYQYRLVVQGSSDSLLRQVRQIVPDAFRTTIDGRRVVQAGLFVTREEAEAVQRQLAQIDAPSSIFDVSYGVAQRPSSPSRFLTQDGRTVIVIDPGHGGGDPGAVGIGGIHEADIVLDIAQQVADLLDTQGIRTVMTRSSDQEVDLQPRVDLADSVNADLFVSIHANAISLSRPDVNGIETYYYDTGSALAASIHNSLVSATGMSDRGIRQARFYVLTRTSMPAVLVEVGFVTGREDVARLQTAAGRSQIAAAIAQGILRYVQ